MRQVQNSDEVQTDAARYARGVGYNVHHDLFGWYVIGPNEKEPASGRSLGFDGRRHFEDCADAWLWAQKLALRWVKRHGYTELVATAFAASLEDAPGDPTVE